MATDFQAQKTDDELRFIINTPSFYHPDLVLAARQELLQRGVPLTSSGAAAPTAAGAPVRAQRADFQAKKTDDELRFIFNNPTYYHADLVEAAQQELRRRGAPLVLPVAATETPAAAAAPVRTGPVYQPITYQSPPAPEPRPGRVYLGLGLVALLLAAVGGYWYAKTPPPPAAKAHRPPPRLVEVATTPLPNSVAAVARCVDAQAARLPAAERADARNLRQYRELARRFWAAETLTEYLIEQARLGKTSPAFDEQVRLAYDAWGQWGKARVYTYKFGPVMTDHLDRMTSVAAQQTQILADLPADVAAHRFPPTDDESQKRTADIADLLHGLLPKSPITGQPYPAIDRRIEL